MAKRWPSKKRLSGPGQAAEALPATLWVVNDLVSTWRLWLPRVLLIVAATFWIYWPALRGDWVLDDTWYRTDSPMTQGLAGLGKFWFQPGSWVEYYPIEETVLWVQWQLWGNDTLGYHLTNVSLHITSALLIWWLFRKLGLRLAWLGGLLFALHPVQVESVACITELKNTLSLPPFLLAMGAWIDYEEQGRRQDYRRAVEWFLVAMLCKITVAPFPVMMLLYAWWKRGRIGSRDLKATVPFWIIAVVLGYATVWAGDRYREFGHVLPDVVQLGDFFTLTIGAGLNLAFYFSQCFLPVVLTPYHPKWTVDLTRLAQLLPWPVFGGVLYVLWRKRETWGRHVLLGLGFFLLGLAPFIGFHEVSYMSYTWVCDHLLYIPVIGLIGVVVAGWGRLELLLPGGLRVLGRGIGVVALALMAWQGHAYAKLFVNDEAILADALKRDPGSWIARHNLGCAYIAQGRFPEAIAQLEEAIRINPDFGDAAYNLGVALEKNGQAAEAETQYRQALKLDPLHVNTYVNLGMIARRKGDVAGAEELLHHAVVLAPNNGIACTDLGDLLLQTGRGEESVPLYRQAVAVAPDVAQLRYNLGNALLHTSRLPEAIEQLQAAVALDPQLAQAHENLGVALARTGNVAEAIGEFQAALGIDPDYVTARDNLGTALEHTGHPAEAVAQYRLALKTKSDDAAAQAGLQRIQSAQLHATPSLPPERGP